jgi:hypothetical protein
MLDTSGLTKEQELSFREAYNEIDKCFNIVQDDDAALPFENFSLQDDYDEVGIRDIFRITDGEGKAFITFTKVRYNYIGYKGGQYSGEEYQIWGVATLPKDFGHLIIRPETLKDRIVELLKPMEINFPDDRAFCKRFYVLANDREKAAALLTPDFRNEMKQILLPEFSIDVLNNYLLIANRKLVGKTEALAFASFVFNVSELNY